MMMALPYGTKRIMSSYAFSTGDDGPPLSQPSTTDSASGTCTNGWICEHRWPGIRNLGRLSGALRKETGAAGYTNWWDNGSSQVSFSGGEGFFAINNDGWTMDGGVQTGLPAGKYCNLAVSDIEGCTETFNVDATGLACVQIDAGAENMMVYTTLDARVGEFAGTNECKDLASGPISECVDCSCPNSKKLDCGFMGVTQQGCLDKGCAWCPTTRDTPWCIWLAEGVDPPPPDNGGGNNGGGGNGGGTCPPVQGREDCGHSTITEGECLRKGCVWCPAYKEAYGVPWCTYSSGSATTTTTTRATSKPTPGTSAPASEEECLDTSARECGWSGMTPQECINLGCHWCPYVGARAHCVLLSSTTDPTSIDTTPDFTSGTTTESSSIGTTQPSEPGDPDAPCLPTQTCPPAANCNIPGLIDREDCGELASTPATCVASGCCWEEQPPGPIPDDPEGRWPPWCYYPSK